MKEAAENGEKEKENKTENKNKKTERLHQYNASSVQQRDALCCDLWLEQMLTVEYASGSRLGWEGSTDGGGWKSGSNPPLVGVGIGQILDVSDNHSY